MNHGFIKEITEAYAEEYQPSLDVPAISQKVIEDISYSADEHSGEKIIVTLHGMDVYQPRTGEIRSSNTKDIACWFIDTNYDGKSFFVRQAYFTGVNKPYQKLQKALK